MGFLVTKFETGLFVDSLGGIPLNQTITICGPAGAGKTLLGLILSLRFLDNFFDAIAIYIDPENTISKYDLRRLCEKNGIPEYTLNQLKISNLTSPSSILTSIEEMLGNINQSYVMVVIDPITSLFLEYAYRISTVQSKKVHIAEYIHKTYSFLTSLKRMLSDYEYLLIVIDQVRALPQNSNIPEFWRNEGLIPAFWNILQIFTDTCFLLKKIRRNLILMRIVFSKNMPETMGIIRIGKDIIV